ncbi:conserved protein of unknown function [Candidatus Nitrosocosmicus franklandus]|uniref:Uncharacterized protein n=2 Tax=Candidatus Nitrosocosmicus franklandianus TaxID=1798806 RepID=A0A484IDS3_9ARCH|nr:conserved protein of unknown function [Candidatus Nitrosocosmicus franklandus]
MLKEGEGEKSMHSEKVPIDYFDNFRNDNDNKKIVATKKNSKDGYIVIYGLSTEGYEIAKKIIQGKSKVIIIDENSRLGIVLTSEIVKEFPNINFLTDEEPLLNLEPFDKAIVNAPVIFFAPRIRKINQDVKNEIIQKFKELITYLTKNTAIVINVPLGIGGNNEIITLIEHQSGLIVGTDILYYYDPMTHNSNPSQIIIGSYQQQTDTDINPFINSILNLATKKDSVHSNTKVGSIIAAELNHSINVINRYSSLTCINEITRFAKLKEDKKEILHETQKNIYFDEIANALFDLRIISHSLSSSSALSYLVNGTIKSIEGFVKSLVDETRSQLKKREIKASRTKVTILWTIDNHEIRGDKAIIRELLESKLRDYIAEVEVQDVENYIPNSLNNIIIACSNFDYNKIIERMNSNVNQHHPPNYKIIIISANSTFDTVEI